MMGRIIVFLVVFVGIAVIGLVGAAVILRGQDARALALARAAMLAAPGDAATKFDLKMLDGLPAAAQRYFKFSIAPGTHIGTVTLIKMHGHMGLGDQTTPNYVPFTADQIFLVPEGFVWDVRAQMGPVALSGSDGFWRAQGWTRFWLAGLVPIVRAGGTSDFARSAYGRLIAEAVFWAPASLLPSDNVIWTPVSDNLVRVQVTHQGFSQSAEIEIGADGAPMSVVIARWSDANPDKVFRLQPFGGTASGFQWFGGYRLATRLEGGNFFGTAAYFPFYKAQIDQLEVR